MRFARVEEIVNSKSGAGIRIPAPCLSNRQYDATAKTVILSSPVHLWSDKTNDDNAKSCSVQRCVRVLLTREESEGGPRPTLLRTHNLLGLVGWASAHLQGPSRIFGDVESDVIGSRKGRAHSVRARFRSESTTAAKDPH